MGLIPIYEMRQAEACAVDPGQLRTIQQVSGPWPLGLEGVHLPIRAPVNGDKLWATLTYFLLWYYYTMPAWGSLS